MKKRCIYNHDVFFYQAVILFVQVFRCKLVCDEVCQLFTMRLLYHVLLDFSLTVKAVPHECVIRTS